MAFGLETSRLKKLALENKPLSSENRKEIMSTKPDTFGQPPKDSLWPHADFTQSNYKTEEKQTTKHIDNPYKIAEENEVKAILTTDDHMNKINYKYNEDKALKELSQYINSTYDEHYSKNKFQATEFVIDGGHGEGFCIGNILKYAQRYGKKNGKDRKDLLKVIHYCIIALYVNEMENK